MIFGRSRRWFLGFGGWIVALMLFAVLAPQLWRHFERRISFLQGLSWEKTFLEKSNDLANISWKDSRPLDLFFGDSHVEGGRWYEACQGRHAIRNCGLSMAQIEDVSKMISAIQDRPVDSVLLLCGINDLGRKKPIPVCIKDFNLLLERTKSVLQPRRIFVVSVMPVRVSATDSSREELNLKVTELNRELEKLCTLQNATFINLQKVVSESDGALRDEYNFDGLHLNAEGYRAVSSVICDALSFSRP
jgi:hypothetical protein